MLEYFHEDFIFAHYYRNLHSPSLFNSICVKLKIAANADLQTSLFAFSCYYRFYPYAVLSDGFNSLTSNLSSCYSKGYSSENFLK